MTPFGKTPFGKIRLFVFLFILAVTLNAGQTVTIAMCHPVTSQVQNIEYLYQSNLIPLEKIHLIGVYHENEVDDYQKARDYVKDRGLSWVTFEKIQGEVAVEDMYKTNGWTEQFRKIFKKTDGIIFTGGADFPPAFYEEGQHLLTDVTTPNRSLYEASFLFHLIGSLRNPQFVPFLDKRPDYPVLGICLGAQTMNVAAGGSLYQDIPMEIYRLVTVQQVLKQKSDNIHSGRYAGALYPLQNKLPPTFHGIALKKDSFFSDQMGLENYKNPHVLSAHHQAIKKLGKNLMPIATSIDGKVIEAIRHNTYKNVLGVQFHPEYHPIFEKGNYYRT
ncbi:MAG: hypothetical protein GY765_39460, partial [bacterium]|nr:hypothetical protein [bacterium]